MSVTQAVDCCTAFLHALQTCTSLQMFCWSDATAGCCRTTVKAPAAMSTCEGSKRKLHHYWFMKNVLLAQWELYWLHIYHGLRSDRSVSSLQALRAQCRGHDAGRLALPHLRPGKSCNRAYDLHQRCCSCVTRQYKRAHWCEGSLIETH